MTENALLKKTLELSRIVRNAVIYLVALVHDEEDRKLVALMKSGTSIQIKKAQHDLEIK